MNRWSLLTPSFVFVGWMVVSVYCLLAWPVPIEVTADMSGVIE